MNNVKLQLQKIVDCNRSLFLQTQNQLTDFTKMNLIMLLIVMSSSVTANKTKLVVAYEKPNWP
jgi:hypothetical protein